MFTSTSTSELPHSLILGSSPYEISPELGLFAAVTLKSCSVEPLKGECLFREVEPDVFMNRWGLDNPGIEVVAASILPQVLAIQPNVILSAFFTKADEVEPFLKHVPFGQIKALEVNVSCPNRKAFSTRFEVIEAVQRLVAGRVPVGAKLGPDAVLTAADGLTVDFISYANTEPGFREDFGLGGISGKPVQAKVISNLEHLRARFKGVIVAGGGVKSAEDYKLYKSLGADYVSVASHYLKSKEVAYNILAGL